MLTFAAIMFFIIGYRVRGAPGRKHYIWVAVVAALGVFSATETARKVATMHGNRFEYDPLTFLGAWLYSACCICAGLLVGAWLGSRYLVKGSSRKMRADEEAEIIDPAFLTMNHGNDSDNQGQD